MGIFYRYGYTKITTFWDPWRRASILASMSPSSPSLSPDEPELSVEEARSSCLCHFPPTRTTPRVLSARFSSWSESSSELSKSLVSASSSLLPRSSLALQLQVQQQFPVSPTLLLRDIDRRRVGRLVPVPAWRLGVSAIATNQRLGGKQAWWARADTKRWPHTLLSKTRAPHSKHQRNIKIRKNERNETVDGFRF